MTQGTLPPIQDSTVQKALDLLWHPEAVNDPYPGYEYVREISTAGVLDIPEHNIYLLTGHAINNAVLRSPNTIRGKIFNQATESESEALILLKNMMLFQNDASHRRLRGLVQKAFTPRVVEEQRELVQTLGRDLLIKMKRTNNTDIVSGLSNPLPARIIMTMLGLKPQDEDKFVRWSQSTADLLGGAANSPEVMAQLEKDAKEMREYFRDLADELRANPQPGLLSALAAVQDEGEQLSGDELLSNSVLLLTAGHETTSNLIPGALLEMSFQPEAWKTLIANPKNPNIPDELIRVVSPVQYDGRVIAKDIEFEGICLKSGRNVQNVLGAANRDSQVFSEPNRINLERSNSKNHLGFAAGPHYCLGASLARLEITEVFTLLAEQYPNLKVINQKPPFKPNAVLRGVSRLDVELNSKEPKMY